jgi:hypothetical protein
MCQGKNFFYLGFPNSILKPTLLNVLGLHLNEESKLYLAPGMLEK